MCSVQGKCIPRKEQKQSAKFMVTWIFFKKLPNKASWLAFLATRKVQGSCKLWKLTVAFPEMGVLPRWWP